MSANNDYDVIIIGTGAGGGTLAYRLAPSGLRILLLERGPFLPREKQNWDVRSVFVDGRYVSKDTWYDRKGHAFQPGSHYFVGGATKMYGAALFRLREEDFGELKHHDGISPAWPISYDALEPYYTEAEQLYHVHGLRGADPTEPPASAPYPHPPLSHEPRIQELYDGLERAGYQPFPAPTGILLNERDRSNSPCIRCNTCDGFPCLVQAKADAETVCVRPALRHPNVTLMANAHVKRLKTDAIGRTVTEVDVDVDGVPATYRANVVVVSCGAANSARLLLMSANDKHPRGLANRSDQVGRNYMFHNSQAVVALSKRKNPTMFQKTLSMNDFYFGSSDCDYPLGNIQMIGKSQGLMFREDTHGWVPGFSLDLLADHAVDFWLTTEDLPDPNNRVTIDAKGEIHLDYTFNNKKPTQKLKAALQSMLKHLDMHEHLLPNNVYLGKTIPIAGVGHQAGTCRFGTDPDASVLDVDCKAHDLDNLYVVDTSFFPSIAAVNPSLTVMANALRVGDHLLERFGATAVRLDRSSSGAGGGVIVNSRKLSTSPNQRRALLWMSLTIMLLGVRALRAESQSAPLVAAVDSIDMVVDDADRAAAFYSEVLSFEKVSDVEVAGEEYERYYGTFGLRLRLVRMKLGDETIGLVEYLVPKGRPVPPESRSNDRWFQHIAIITGDMDKAYQHLREHRVEHASTGPQRLPDWNAKAAGIKAFYFKDPDGHPLEVLQFPAGKGDSKWHQPSDRLFLGIDHTAIVVRRYRREPALLPRSVGLVGRRRK